ncbi:hypothetical protein AX17_001218 [Amanita inopinata Kibby_2008]|nr:hypothetical protein AX17_001218 [Amanita inopinata Kibby_2008]
MNSLAYLSRQFDVLASPKSDDSPNRAPIQRVPTWSSFAPFRPFSPKRSNSSPAFLSSNTPPYPPPSYPIHSPPTTAPPDTCPRSKPHLESIFRRIFFIRVFLLVWGKLTQAWSSISTRISVACRRGPLDVHFTGTTTDSIKEASGTNDEEVPESPSSSRRRFTVDPSVSVYTNCTATATLAVELSLSQTVSPIIDRSLVTVRSATPATPSRTSTPTLYARKAPFHQPKTLVLDLDETLVHSTSRPMNSSSSGGLFGLKSFGKQNSGTGHMVEVVLQGRSTLYHVYKRPFADFFLRTVSGWYTLVIFTASMQEYADPVIDWLDAGRGILVQRFFRDSCTQLPNGSYTKDLSIIESDLSRVCLVDNSPISYRVNEANGIPIEGWTHDPSDEALLDLLPVLDSLRFTSDVRRVLGLRSAGLYRSVPP